MHSKTSALGAKNFLKYLISKIGNGLLVSIGFTLGIGIVGLVYSALSWVPQTPAGVGSPLTSTIWNDMVNNMGYLKENVEGVASKFGTLTTGKMCTTDGTKVNCATAIPTSGITTEIDPKVGTLTEGKMCTSVSGKVTCTSDLPSILTLQTQITTLQTQVTALEARACPVGYTMKYSTTINNGEDIYPTSGVIGSPTDTCDNNKFGMFTACATNLSNTCTDTYYSFIAATYYYRTVTCRLAPACQ